MRVEIERVAKSRRGHVTAEGEEHARILGTLLVGHNLVVIHRSIEMG